MLKKALLATAVLAATSGVVFANGGTYAPAASTHEGNFYLGAAISRDVTDFEASFNNDVIDGATLINTFNFSHDQNADGVNGEIFAGYGWLFNDHYYLGGEVFGSISSTQGEFDVNDVVGGVLLNLSNTYRMRGSIGVAVLPGMKLSDSTLGYLRVGYVNSQFRLNTSTIPALGETTFDEAVNFRKNKGAVQLGLGVESMVTNNVSVRAEYDYNRYGTISRGAASAVACGDETCTAISTLDIKPIVDQFKLAASYHFYS